MIVVSDIDDIHVDGLESNPRFLEYETLEELDVSCLWIQRYSSYRSALVPILYNIKVFDPPLRIFVE